MSRWQTKDKSTQEVILPTEYHHSEGAISHRLRLPTLIFADGVIANRGVFNRVNQGVDHRFLGYAIRHGFENAPDELKYENPSLIQFETGPDNRPRRILLGKFCERQDR